MSEIQKKVLKEVLWNVGWSAFGVIVIGGIVLALITGNYLILLPVAAIAAVATVASLIWVVTLYLAERMYYWMVCGYLNTDEESDMFNRIFTNCVEGDFEEARRYLAREIPCEGPEWQTALKVVEIAKSVERPKILKLHYEK